MIIGSTRPGRLGKPIADWLASEIETRDDVELRVLDLAEINLPMMDEPNHPRLQHYTHDHTRAWSAQVAACDAFIVVTPEYNGMPPAPLLNAMDYLYHEWNNKPLAIVSYGGVSAGLRSASALKDFFQMMQMWVVPPAVSIPFVAKNIKDGVFTPSEATVASVTPMVDAIVERHALLAQLRA